ncbi:MAG: AraC family transcriptional regulator [Sedimentisphaerales bacterium]|nr:AraC family transcriptional regulator [Sedimentisphaerales bacterium]
MKEDTRTTYQERILKVLLYIQEHLYEELGLDKLASIAYFSPYHFHRIFRGMVGESLAEYIRRLRIERAAGILVQTQRSITDISLEAGYDNLESFIRAFKSRFDMSPSEYRQEKANSASNFKKDSLPEFAEIKGDKLMDVKIKKLKPRKVVFVRHTGPYDQCGPAWKKLCSWAGPKRLFGFSTKFLGLCYDDPDVTEPEKIRYDACITVTKDVEPEGEIGVQEIPQGEYAITLHKGPLEKLSETYSRLCGQWLPQSGREAKNFPSVEIYLKHPDKTKPEKMKVEIQLLLEEK